ncbi:MAG: hypothetical protein JJT90_16045, partial [Ectothiorhodospiraceae bacterium]|nr:hypothetical protein [Ectothiorhodospiraceae bacterium]
MTDKRMDGEGRADGFGKAGPAGQPESALVGPLKLILMAVVAVAVVVVGLHSLTRYAAEGFGHHEVVRILVQGQSLHVPEHELDAFGASLRGYVDEQHARTLAEIDGMIDARVDALFESAFTRVPDYVDWYYSLGASGMRLGTLILRDLEAHIQRSVEQRLLGGERFGDGLEAVTRELDQTVLASQQGLKPAIEAWLLSRYAGDSSVVAPAQEPAASRSFDLSAALSRSLAADQEDVSRWTRSSGVGMFAAGSATAGRIVATSAVLRGAVAQAGRGLAALAARRAATAAPAAATASAVAAPSG